MLNIKWIITMLLGTGLCTHTSAQKNDSTRLRTLLVFFDGLRPDYITPENMPNVYAFKQTAAYGRQHHSVFPTVTRVNAASYATGSYPGTHGLVGNTVYFPKVNPVAGLSTGNADNLMKIAQSENGRLLTTASLGEILSEAGERMMVFSSGSTGQAFLQNHTVGNGMIVNPEMILPLDKKDAVLNAIGKVPEENELDNKAWHEWTTNALIHFGLAVDGPLVSAIWFSDPDGAAHTKGIGSAEAVRSIKTVDEQFGRIMAHLKNNGLLQYYNIIISADHGFVTYAGKHDLSDFLVAQKLKQNKQSDDVVVADGAIYVKDHDQQMIQKIVSALQQQEWIGAVFTKGKNKGDMKGSVAGTLSFEAVHWDHPRSGDILADMNWNDNKNDKGFAGTSFSEGVAGHGSISPYEIHIALIASGPSFRQSFQSNIPTSNVDITPTLLYIYHLKAPPIMDGRVMSELLAGSRGIAPKPVTQTVVTRTKINNIVYKLSLNKTSVGKNAYINYARVERLSSQ
jgi:predicted AlkP superfamily pyrophosphatase or phosphodiesterase